MLTIEKNLYQLDIPLPGSPLRGIHTYFIKGDKRNLLIDTAFNSDECEAVLLQQIELLGGSMENTDIFITHMHVDHSGLISALKRDSNTVYASSGDAELIHRFQKVEHWDWLTKNNEWSGIPKEHALDPKEHVAFQKRPSGAVAIKCVEDGDQLCYGGYQLQVVDLGGHTPGQIGLWENSQKILFCGDHILERISPNITTWDLEHDYVAVFCRNLLKVKTMEPQKLLSAHGSVIHDIGGRIDQLIQHHNERLDQMEDIIRGGQKPMSAFEVAIRMRWSSGKSFEQLPVQQKWFAASETLAHLRALVFLKRLNCMQENEMFLFSI